MSDKLKIAKRSKLKGDDGYRIFSIRIKEETVHKLDEISIKSNRSRNELINIMLEFATENCEIIEDKVCI